MRLFFDRERDLEDLILLYVSLVITCRLSRLTPLAFIYRRVIDFFGLGVWRELQSIDRYDTPE